MVFNALRRNLFSLIMHIKWKSLDPKTFNPNNPTGLCPPYDGTICDWRTPNAALLATDLTDLERCNSSSAWE